MKPSTVVFILISLAALACAQSVDVVTPADPGVPATVAADGPRFGIAGLIPRNYPNAADADWINLYEILPETGELFGFYSPWADAPESEGEIPALVETAFGLAPRYDFTPVIALGYFHETADYQLEPTLDFNDPAQRQRAVQAAAKVAETYRPEFLALGIEVNRYYAENPTGYANYESLYFESYRAVKAVSPETRVFPILQYELLRGGQFFSGDGENETQWELIERFGDQLDMIAFTTYPFLLYQTPAELPVDYYTEIAQYTDVPIAFTELGWPSAPLSVDESSPFGGSETEQAEFVATFFDLTAKLDLAIVLWSFPHDIGEGINPAFASVSLRHNDGRAKPALGVWGELTREE